MCTRTLTHHSSPVVALAVMHDGTLVSVSGDDRMLRDDNGHPAIDPMTGRLLKNQGDDSIQAVW